MCSGGCLFLIDLSVQRAIFSFSKGRLVASAVHNEYCQNRVIKQQNNSMGNVCTDKEVERLEVINSYNKGLEVKLKQKSNLSDAQLKEMQFNISKSVTAPKLSQKIAAVLKQQLRQKPISNDSIYRGMEMPAQFLPEKNVYYQGEWSGNQPHGKGSVFFSNGGYIEGYFNRGQVEGIDNLLIFADGSFYRGGIKNQLFQGRGKYVSNSGMIFRGEWREGVPFGKGEQIFPDGNSYTGNFEKGLKHGMGIFKWSDGKIYQGEFRGGKMHGQGKIYKGQQIFEGFFQNNKKVGKCKLKTKYGAYDSSFKDGIITGDGTFEWKDHTVYRGPFLNGLPHGEGAIQFSNGKIVSGIFENGKNTKVVDVEKRGSVIK